MCGCLGGSEPSLRYFESVRQSPGCAEALCFDEVLALEDGTVLMKRGNSSGHWVEFCSADPKRLSRLFADIDAQLKASTLKECENCATYHLFYNSGSQTRYMGVPSGLSSMEAEIHKKAGEICSNRTDTGLIHVIWGENGGYIDYHVFSNDVIVYESFGLRDGELLDSKAYRVEGIFEALKSDIPPGFFESQTRNNCPKDSMFYGYVEAALGGRHREFFTCGDDTPAGAAFTSLVQEVEGL
jgi:hypothetical protein